jgi:hypothetical protein
MNPLLKKMLARYMAPAGDDGPDAGGTGTVDRGDDFTPTIDDDEPSPTPAPAPKDEEKEPVEKDKPDDEKEKGKPRKDDRLPLSRHKEILDKERAQRAAVEAELKALKQGQVVATTNEQITEAETAILGLEKQYTSLLADGELDKAAAVMSQIRASERAIIEAKAAFQTQAAEARAYQRVQYDNTVERLLAAYPVLDDEHEDFDNELTGEVMDLKAAYETRGLTPAEALKKAAKVLMGAATTRQKASVETDVRVTKEDLAKATAEERRKAAVAKNLEVAGKQPPSTKDVGLDSDKMGGGLNARDVIKMPQEQFNKLDEAQLAKMRGDDI